MARLECQFVLCIACVTKQPLYVSIFFTRLSYVCTALISGTQNPEISGLSTAHAYKYRTKHQVKKEAKTEKEWHFVTSLPLYLENIAVRTDHKN